MARPDGRQGGGGSSEQLTPTREGLGESTESKICLMLLGEPKILLRLRLRLLISLLTNSFPNSSSDCSMKVIYVMVLCICYIITMYDFWVK